MGIFDLTLGCLLIASWANMILFTLEVLQIYHYFSKYPKDSWFNKSSVLLALSSDFMTVFACLAANYLYMVTHWGPIRIFSLNPGTVWAMSSAASPPLSCAALTSHRSIKKQWLWIPLIVICIIAGITGAGVISALRLKDPSYAGRGVLVKWVTLWLSGCAGADAVITGVLVYKFRTMKSVFSDTQNSIRRLWIAAVRNGAITTVISISTVIVSRFIPRRIVRVDDPLRESQLIELFSMTVGRVYTLSMLSNLNNRATLLGDSQGSSAKKTLDANANILRIRQDVETHFQVDGDVIQMGDIEYGGQNRTRHADSNSDVELDQKRFANGF
ncbi:hypothetical protein DFH09DRAFT_1362580 [Mycena vulgaris]|nr:hypothetical protein DFH09DRAFT_1362580 [Mycena vulgaris]